MASSALPKPPSTSTQVDAIAVRQRLRASPARGTVAATKALLAIPDRLAGWGLLAEAGRSHGVTLSADQTSRRADLKSTPDELGATGGVGPNVRRPASGGARRITQTARGNVLPVG